MRASAAEFVAASLRGVGQIFLQESAWAGALLVLGIGYGSPWMGAAVLVGTLAGMLTARVQGHDRGHISSGLYGFNAALVGAALSFYFAPSALLALVLLAAAALSTVLMHWFLRHQLTAYTFPFILLTWVSVPVLHRLGAPAMMALPVAPGTGPLALVGHGFGQVIFQGDLLAGALFFVAVFIHSPVGALYGMAGALAAAAAAHHLYEPAAQIQWGLFSFNGVLCGVAFAGPTRRDGVLALVAVLASVAIHVVLIRWHLLPLTFPFVLASWLTLLVKRVALKRLDRGPSARRRLDV